MMLTKTKESNYYTVCTVGKKNVDQQPGRHLFKYNILSDFSITFDTTMVCLHPYESHTIKTKMGFISFSKA